MGIKGLLVELRPITNRVHISEFKGRRVGIDASCWLHRSAFTCALQLALGKPTRAWISWCISMMEMLQNNGIQPTFVFDGIALPQKKEENQRRGELRAEARQRGLDLLKAGNTAEAGNVFQQAISISPEMQREFIMALRDRHIDYIVAPYEADAQLGYLFQSGNVDVIISEDSDLLLFGVRRLITKLAKDGFGELTDMEKLNSADAKKSRFTDALRSLSHEQFLTVCIMSGCDYLDGLPRIGLKTALKYACEHTTSDRILRAYCRKHPLPPDYHAKFNRALMTFQHQRIYDPSSGTMRHLSGVKDLENDGDYLGADISKEIISDLVTGALNTKTMVVVPLNDPVRVADVPAPAPAPPLKILCQPAGLKVFSDEVNVHRKKQKDFNHDVALLKDIFGSSQDREPSFAADYDYSVLKLETETFVAVTNITPVSKAVEEKNAAAPEQCSKENQAPVLKSSISMKSTASTNLSIKRPAPSNSKWVKRIKKPIQHVQRRLTEFFAVKQT